MKKLLVALMAITMLATGMIGDSTIAKAEAGEATKIYVCDSKVNLVVVPGETKHIKLPVRSADLIMYNPLLTLEPSEGAPFTLSLPYMSLEGSTLSATMFTPLNTVFVEFDVVVKETANIGKYPVTLNATSVDIDTGESYSLSLKFELQILQEKAPAQLTIKNVQSPNAAVGSSTQLSFYVDNEGERKALSTYVSVEYGETGITADYTTKNMKVGDIEAGKSQLVKLPVKILPNAISGMKTITVTFKYKDDNGISFTDSYDIYVNVGNSTDAPQVILDDVTYTGTLKPGNDFTLTAAIYNGGNSTASNITVKVKDESLGATGIIKNYYTDTIDAGSLRSGSIKKVELPLSVTGDAAGGTKELILEFSFKDSTGVTYTTTTKVYPQVISGSVPGDGSANILISNVKQSPEKPVAGEKLEVSFDLINKSSVDLSELKISTDNLNGTTFIPVESEPYQYIEKLKGGQKIRVTIPLIVSDSIPEGLNNLVVSYKYSGSSETGTVTIPIHDVQNDLGSSSKPKLIVSKYYTDTEELRAGATFKFTFDIYNTNSAVSAKNITVTVSQPENVFTVTQGSNSFFISKIAPGETVSNTLEMKVKSDASTKTYPLEVLIEYEYDGAEPNPTTGEIGESRKETLNLQAVENSRPVIDYVNVYSYNGMVMVGTDATLSFQFYNMGRSALNNVIVRLESDALTKTDGDMYFIGNVEAGSSSYIEFPVMPNMEGSVSGVLKLTFEDSNGDEVEYTKDFTTDIMGAQVIDPGIPTDGSGEVFNPAPIAKKAILPIWAFIIIQIILFAIFVPVTRIIIINVYKAKLRKKEQDEY
jgi:hypothetical protein